MKMSDKLKWIQVLVNEFHPDGVNGELFYEDLQRVLNGEIPVERVEMKHKCIYANGVCDCGNKLEDHDKNYPPPKYDAHGLLVGSEAYEKFYRLNG